MADPREEAERLVAAALASASIAIENIQTHGSTAGFATGSAECCVCPVCRAIASVRDPSPEFAERLATGAGDLAVGLAGVLRAFSSAASTMAASNPAARTQAVPNPADSKPGAARPDDDVWSAATRAPQPSGTPDSASQAAPGSSEPAATPPPGTPPPPRQTAPTRPPMAKKAVKPKKATPPPVADKDPEDG